MLFHLRRLTTQLALLMLTIPVLAAAAPIRLATLEWRPYVSAQLPGNGFTAQVVSLAAARLDRQSQFEFLPWVRAMKLGSSAQQFSGYFPAYYTEERAALCHFSAPVGMSTIGLAYLKTAPVVWRTLNDLQPVRVGVVLGFSNGKEFDALVASKGIAVEISETDLLNVKKLLAHRSQAIVIDRLVLRYLLMTEPGLAGAQSQIEFGAKPLAELSMHVCFQRNAAGQQLQTGFDKALQGIDLQRVEAEYFEQLRPRQH